MICRYFNMFIIYSFMGWIYESIVMTLWNGKWDNRGFLFGPLCPIYGIGALSISILFDKFSFGATEIFLIGMVGSAVLEYTTAWMLEVMFHAYWWDYSGVPLNIKGRICVPATVGFGIAALVVVYWIYPFVSGIVNMMGDTASSLMALSMAGMIGADIALTSSALCSFERRLKHFEKTIDSQVKHIISLVQGKASEAAEIALKSMYAAKIGNAAGVIQRAATRRIVRYNPGMEKLIVLIKTRAISESTMKDRGLVDGTKNKINTFKEFKEFKEEEI